jgi:dienelactone hydrolase
VDGRGRRLAGLLVCGALVAAGCTTGGDHDGGRPAVTAAPPGPPPATRSAAYGKPCLRDRERAAAFRFRVGQGFDQDQVDDDVVAAVAELRRRGVAGVVLVGSSMGGTALLVAAARIRPAVAGVVSLSGGAVFGGMDARTAVVRLRVPVLFVAARRDGPFASAARGLYGAAATRDKRLLVLGSAAHGSSLLSFGGEAARVRAALRGFVTAHLGR